MACIQHGVLASLAIYPLSLAILTIYLLYCFNQLYTTFSYVSYLCLLSHLAYFTDNYMQLFQQPITRLTILAVNQLFYFFVKLFQY